MSDKGLTSIDYEPAGHPSLFDRWEKGGNAILQAPLAVRDPDYRKTMLKVFENLPAPGRRIIGIGSGNGLVEAELAAAGWDVLATDPCHSALRLCGDKGLATVQLVLGEKLDGDRFDVSYTDGVMGHLWEPEGGTSRAWRHLARLGAPGSLHVTSNDLSDNDRRPRFAVNASPEAEFYRPPLGAFEREATQDGLWTCLSSFTYTYLRREIEPRRREILVLKLLLDEGVEAEDLS